MAFSIIDGITAQNQDVMYDSDSFSKLSGAQQNSHVALQRKHPTWRIIPLSK